ncbi:MAG: AAA domain-containing protein, partial [Thermosulfidibacteraceae bacterium]
KLEKDLKVYEERKIKEEEDLASLKERHKNLTAEYETVEENCKELMQKFSELLLRIKNFFREKVPMLDANSPEETYKFLRQKESEIEAKLEEIDSKIKQIEIKLERLKQELIENAIVIGTTLTKTYISKDLYKKKFDIVIVDEVSTSLLPALFFACSLAASKIVIVGDFKQLGPVVRNSDNEVVEAWLKRDIFEITGIAKKIDAGLEDEKLIILR